jgi:DNA-binding response OmpR family regulator
MPKRILIVEDEPSIIVSLEFLLRESGHEVMVARDGAEALRLAGSVRPDLVVLDVMLPSVNGFEVCRRLRDNAATRDIRILMLTARGRESEAATGKAAGADAYMSKPFATKELVRIVASLVESARS